MSQDRIPDRERQALREVGRTVVWFRTALATTLLFVGVIVGVPLAQAVIGPSPIERFRELGSGLATGWRAGESEGWLAGNWLASNRRMLAAMDDFETGLEDESFLRERFLPPIQSGMTRFLGVGNEQAYVGRGGWLLYRPDVDHVTGPSFLDEGVLERRRRGGNAWETPVEPDPLPAIATLAEDLGSRGIELIVVPTPVKPAILPGAMVWRPTAPPPLRNPGWSRFVATLEKRGVTVVDVAELLAALPVENESPYLTTDTHWTPRAMDAVARHLAEETRARLGEADTAASGFDRRETRIEGRGDIEAMLKLPASTELFPRQVVTVSMVTDDNGRPWKSDPSAAVLILGDSFTNVFSDASLGWGRGAGLAEQLAFHLGRPVDRIALNAGGSNATRRALSDALTADPRRLDGKEVVIYQFATRELSSGDWPVLRLPETHVNP